MAEQRPWHQYFGLSWTDFLRGAPFTVEPEKDLSHKQQLLDLVLIRGEGGQLPRRAPDGFEDLARYNLISFKSYQETLNGLALNELVGHYVNLMKQVSPSMQDLLPETDFRLFAVCVRFPQNLTPHVTLEAIQAGVYRVRHFSGFIRLIVINQLPREPHNAMLHLYSANQGLVEYGARNYQPYSKETSTLLRQLIDRYREEGVTMPETLEQFAERTLREYLDKMPVEKRLEGIPLEKRLEGVPVGKRLEGVPVEQVLEGLTPEQRAELLRLASKQNPQGQS
jgi:hypothetical protein